jgi:Na+/proline symporter
MLISGVVFILYTTLGGQHSVIKTDVIQFLIIVAGVLVCLIGGISFAGGVQGILADAPAGHWSFPLSPSFGATALLGFLFFVGLPYLVGPISTPALQRAHAGGRTPLRRLQRVSHAGRLPSLSPSSGSSPAFCCRG